MSRFVLNLLARGWLRGRAERRRVAANPLPRHGDAHLRPRPGRIVGSLEWKISAWRARRRPLILLDTIMGAMNKLRLSAARCRDRDLPADVGDRGGIVGAVLSHCTIAHQHEPNPARAQRLGTLFASGLIVGETLVSDRRRAHRLPREGCADRARPSGTLRSRRGLAFSASSALSYGFTDGCSGDRRWTPCPPRGPSLRRAAFARTFETSGNGPVKPSRIGGCRSQLNSMLTSAYGPLFGDGGGPSFHTSRQIAHVPPGWRLQIHR